MQWKKLITREGVDPTTISGIDVVFYACIRELNKTIREPFFTCIKDKVLSHYLCVDPFQVGRKIYPCFFRTPALARSYYKEGL